MSREEVDDWSESRSKSSRRDKFCSALRALRDNTMAVGGACCDVARDYAYVAVNLVPFFGKGPFMYD